MNIALIALLIVCLVLMIVTLVLIFSLLKKNKSLEENLTTKQEDPHYAEIISSISSTQAKVDQVNTNIRTSTQLAMGEAVTKLISILREQSTKLGQFDTKLTSIQTEINKSIELEVSNQMKTVLKEFKDQIFDVQKSNSEQLNNISDLLNQKLNTIRNNMTASISDGFKQNAEQMEKVNKYMGTIEEAQKNLTTLSDNVGKLNNTLSFSNPAGKFGEKVLHAILESVFGNTRNLYKEQYTLNPTDDANKRVIADAVILLSGASKLLCIDSKASLVRFKDLFNNTNAKDNKDLFRDFKSVLRSEIDKIASSYIIPTKTCEYAIMFIPNDGIFSYIESNDDLYENVVNYGIKKNVILTSPTTLQPILGNIHLFLMREEMVKNVHAIIDNLLKIRKAFENYNESWLSLSKAIDSLSTKRDDFNKKIKTLSNNINRLELPDEGENTEKNETEKVPASESENSVSMNSIQED